VDASTGAVYIADFTSAAVTILNGSRCDAVVTSGCGTAGRQQPVGSEPFGVTINPRTSTIYVTHLFQSGSMSILNAGRH
jgi:DNA-binding beta-propeller fold protein YncE